MCFSPQADLAGGVVLAAIGLDAVRHVRLRRDHLMLASLPFLLAAHQVDEAFVWWGLQGHVPAAIGHVATWVYLLFAFVVLPVYLPASVLALEAPGMRRRVITGFLVVGVVVAIALLIALLHGPVTARLGDHHIAYDIGIPAGLLVVAAYVLVTCGAAIFSGYRLLAVFGVVNLIAVAVLAELTVDGFASLWCAWAAVTAVGIALVLRSAEPSRTVAVALS